MVVSLASSERNVKLRNGRRCSAGRSPRRLFRYSEQLAAIILTVSTFSVGAVVDDADEEDGLADALEDALEAALSSVPLISTLCPTCGVSLASSALKR